MISKIYNIPTTMSFNANTKSYNQMKQNKNNDDNVNFIDIFTTSLAQELKLISDSNVTEIRKVLLNCPFVAVKYYNNDNTVIDLNNCDDTVIIKLKHALINHANK